MNRAKWAVAILLGNLAALGVGPAPVAAQGQPGQPSLGELARRLREQKKNAPKPERIWTNDNLPTTPHPAVSVVGAAPAAEEEPAVAPAGPASTEDKDKERAETEAALVVEKDHQANAEKDLNLLQRDYDLQRQQFYSNPGYTSDAAGKARLDALSTQIGDKQQEAEQTKRKIAALEEKLAKLKAAEAAKPETPPRPLQ